MPWTATFRQVQKDDPGRTAAVVLFTDGQYKIQDTIPLLGHTAASFRQAVENRRQQLEDSYAFIATLDPSSFDLTIPPPEDTKPSDRDVFDGVVDQIQQRKRLVDAGVLLPDDDTLASLTKQAQALFDPAFVS